MLATHTNNAHQASKLLVRDSQSPAPLSTTAHTPASKVAQLVKKKLLRTLGQLIKDMSDPPTPPPKSRTSE
jgi:hypothetical protein